MLPERDHYTTEQIADRWGLDLAYVEHLIFSRQLSQVFLLSGPAKLVMRNTRGHYEIHQDTAEAPAQTRLMVGTSYSLPITGSWELKHVKCVYEYLPNGNPNAQALERYCEEARAKGLDWKIEFCACSTELIGIDSCLVATDDLYEFEQAYGVVPKNGTEPQQFKLGRDRRMERCRAIAQLLWERDPTATLPDVFRHEWIQRIACEGRPVTEGTFRNWVKDLNPNRSPGRRPT
ncbi:MAG: hypothetical protein PHP86_19215 [Nevskiales bacterium]|nr:hypothetical protein [Nevskiales bacterium]